MVKRGQAITLYNVWICLGVCLQRVKYFLEHNYTIIILPLKAPPTEVAENENPKVRRGGKIIF